jgi:glycosyltransferase 2 family protein
MSRLLRSRALRRWGGILVSVLAVGAVVVWALRQEPPRLPTDHNRLLELVAAVGLYGVATVIRGWRWHVILRRLGAGHRTFDSYALVTVGYMGNTVLPARGGEVLRTVLLSGRAKSGKVEILGSIVTERVLDAMSLAVLFVALTWAGIAGSPLGQRPALVAVAVLLAGAAAAWAFLQARRRGKLRGVADKLRPFLRASRPLLDRAGLGLLLVSVLVWLTEGTIFWLVARSLSLPLGIGDGLFLVVLSAFSALIPAAPGYVGTFDAAAIFGLRALHVAGGQAVAFLLLVRCVLFVPITVVGLGLFVTRYAGLSRSRRALRRSPATDLG